MSGVWDTAVVLGIATAMLLVLDWRLTKAFIAHEKREAQMVAEVGLSSDTALGLVRENQRRVRELFELQTLTQAQIASVSDDVRMHEKRLGAVEERIMRAALVVPHVHRRGDDP